MGLVESSIDALKYPVSASQIQHGNFLERNNSPSMRLGPGGISSPK
jgi:hypothetical protein